jgi:hypothetical protein
MPEQSPGYLIGKQVEFLVAQHLPSTGLTPPLLKGFLKNMGDDKSDYWVLAWEALVKNLGVPGLTSGSYRPHDRDVFTFQMRYHGRAFKADISGLVLISPGAKYALANIAEKLVEEICEWMAKGLEEMVNLLPNDWEGDKRPEKPSPLNTWENLFKDDR